MENINYDDFRPVSNACNPCNYVESLIEIIRTRRDIDKLREEFAKLAHEQWSGWMKYMFSKCSETCPEDGKLFHEEVLVVPAWAVKRWTTQMNTPYEELSEAEQESDRVEADKFLSIIKDK